MSWILRVGKDNSHSGVSRTKIKLWQLLVSVSYKSPDLAIVFITQYSGNTLISTLGSFTNYVYKRNEVGGQKNWLFVTFHTIENVNGGG